MSKEFENFIAGALTACIGLYLVRQGEKLFGRNDVLEGLEKIGIPDVLIVGEPKSDLLSKIDLGLCGSILLAKSAKDIPVMVGNLKPTDLKLIDQRAIEIPIKPAPILEIPELVMLDKPVRPNRAEKRLEVRKAKQFGKLPNWKKWKR